MLEHGQVTHSDAFSYTMAGQTWVNVKWLYEIKIALLEKAFGPEGVLLLQCIVNVMIVWLLFRTIEHAGELLKRNISEFQSVVGVLLFLATVEYRMAGRPEMISHLMCALFLFIILRKPQAGWKDIIWLVPAAMHMGQYARGLPRGTGNDRHLYGRHGIKLPADKGEKLPATSRKAGCNFCSGHINNTTEPERDNIVEATPLRYTGRCGPINTLQNYTHGATPLTGRCRRNGTWCC